MSTAHEMHLSTERHSKDILNHDLSARDIQRMCSRVLFAILVTFGIYAFSVPRLDAQSFPVVLSGGPASMTGISIDDDVSIYLNGVLIFVDADLHDESQYGYGVWPPMILSAKNGDTLRVIATDRTSGGCRDLSPLYIHRVSDGAIQALDSIGVQQTCDIGGGGIFYDKSFTIALSGVADPPR